MPAGRPKHEPTEEQRKYVTQMAACGIRHEDIAIVLGLSEPTLRRYYRAELAKGAPQANLTIAIKLFNAAQKGDITAMIFWLKTRAGWRETNVLEVEGKQKESFPPWLLAKWKSGA